MGCGGSCLRWFWEVIKGGMAGRKNHPWEKAQVCWIRSRDRGEIAFSGLEVGRKMPNSKLW